MTLIRYILSHGLLLAFIVVLVLAYHYRTRLFSTEINSRIDTVTTQVADNKAVNTVKGWFEVFSSKEDMVSDSTEPTQSEQLTVAESVPQPEANQAESTMSAGSETQVSQEESRPVTSSPTTEPLPEEAVAETATTQMQTALADSTSMAEQQEPVATEQSPAEIAPVPEVTAPATEQPSAEVAAVPEVTAPAPVAEQPVTVASSTDSGVVEQGGGAGETAPVADDDRTAAKVSHMALLEQARQAFNAGNPDRAISLYQELTELNPDDPNVFGELGNIYYSQGKWKQAGGAYYEAASRLLDQGQAAQVQYLYRVIQGLDQESAEKLAGRLGQ